jgi:hypothetical protein
MQVKEVNERREEGHNEKWQAGHHRNLFYLWNKNVQDRQMIFFSLFVFG